MVPFELLYCRYFTAVKSLKDWVIRLSKIMPREKPVLLGDYWSPISLIAISIPNE